MSEFLLQLRWTGRFGNRMFQYAYGATYARLTGLEFWIPSDWEGTRMFQEQPHPVVESDDIREALRRPDEGEVANQARMQVVRRHYPDAELVDAELLLDPYMTPGHPLCHANGCTYNPHILARMSRRHLQSVFAFNDEVKNLPAYKRYADMQGLYDVAHLRRDDISNPAYNRTHVQGYSVISLQSYRRAFRTFGYAEEDIAWVSDDYSGKWHAGRKVRNTGGWEYPTGSEYLRAAMFDWLDDFLKLYFARTIFRANSSFSWWAACLSPTAKVFSPVMDRSHIYGIDGMQEVDVEFVEGNHPHYVLSDRPDKPDLRVGE